MWMALAQALICGLSSGCGGGGTADGETGAAALSAPDAVASSTTTAVTATTSTSAPATPETPETTDGATVPAGAATGGDAVVPAAGLATVRLTGVKGLTFRFTLAQPRTTSAAVYAADGSLLRTLWRGERMKAGTVSRNWDQRDDAGRELPAGEYQIRVVHHDIRYVWEGVVGNTSTGEGATAPHRAFALPTSLAAGVGRVHYAVGYNESQGLFHGFTPDRPQVDASPVRWTDPFVGAGMVAADGERLYWANTGGLARRSFIAAFDLADGRQTRFGAGRPVCLNAFPGSSSCYPDQAYASVIELRDTLDSPPTGLAVQRNGPLLAVAYGADNAVRLFDKRSGQLLRVLSVTLADKALNQIAFAANGDLWVLSPTAALRYAAAATSPTLVATATGLTRPLAIAADPADDDAIWIADGGASQQLKRVDRAGAQRKVVGRRGGPGSESAVSGDRLCFAQGPGAEGTALAVDEAHAVWVVDSCNNRMLRLAGDGRLLDQIAYLPVVYNAAVDAGNPKRVFANFLEYEVDYSLPLSDPRSWKLVRNWLQALPASLRDGQSANRASGGFQQVQTLPSGRTLATLTVQGAQFVVELQSAGTVRQVVALGAPVSGRSSHVLYENGELGYAVTDATRQSVMRIGVEREDERVGVSWSSAATLLASAPVSDTAPTYRNGTFSGVVGARFPVTANGSVVFFNPGIDANSGYHLGAVARGGSRWSWQASPSGPIDGRGSFQTRKDDPSVQYGGNSVLALGRHVVYGYHGEFYTDPANRRVGQANQFMHFREDGLFLGQFGVPSTRAVSPSQPGLSGNAFSPTLVRAGGQLYLYHNDESSHGGVHRWRLEGADAMQDLSASGRSGSTLTLR